MIQMFDDADKQAAFFYGDGFKGWRDEIEGVHEFLAAIDAKKREVDIKLARQGNTVVRTIKGETETLNLAEVQYSTTTFNPFDLENKKLAEANYRKLYKESDAVT